jgi:hypothetical protein
MSRWSVPRLTLRLFSPLWWFLSMAAALACNVSLFMRDAPPTLQVRVTTPTPAPLTPLPTPTPSALATDTSTPVPALRDMLNDVQSDRLMLAVHSLASVGTRHVLSSQADPTQGIGAARAWLVDQMQGIAAQHPTKNIQVWTQPVLYSWRSHAVTVENVVMVLPGTQVGAGVIVVGAHYDSITQAWEDGAAYAPGANDNASGVAAVLEIGHIMAGRAHRATIILVAFAAEETGKQGSQAFVEQYIRANAVDLRAMLNLDIIGSAEGPNGEMDRRTVRLFSADPNDSSSRQLARQIGLIANTYIEDVTLVLQSSEERRGRWGDHQSFSAAGYPAVRLIQGLENPARQHTGRDTPDGVQPAYLMSVTRLALAAVNMLAGGLPPPALLTLSTRGNDAQTLTLTWARVPGAVSYWVALRKTSSLAFDQVLNVGDVDHLTWPDLMRYHTVALAALDADGQVGVLSPEYPITALLGR